MRTIRVNGQWPLNTPIAAIDLGTSRSAYCTSYIGSETKLQSIEFPDEIAFHAQLKTFTSILIEPHPGVELIENLHQIKKSYFGFQAEKMYYEMEESIQNQVVFCKWFKMSLHNSQADDPESKSSIKGPRVKLSVLLAESLRLIKEAALNSFQRRGFNERQASDVIWVLTVPTIWSDKAKFNMRKAAFNGGLIDHIQSEQLIFCLEPEAVFFTALFFQPLPLDVSELMRSTGTYFMVADCGGGTIDISSYEIMSVEPLRLRQAVEPGGLDCGSTNIDKQFLSFIEELIGVDYYNKLDNLHSKIKFDLLTQWEDIKVRFSSEDCVFSFVIKCGDLQDEVFENSELSLEKLVKKYNTTHSYQLKLQRKLIRLPHELILSFFDDTINETVECILGYENIFCGNQFSLLFLAGGFCYNPILRRRIKESLPPYCQAIEIVNPDIAIVRGAVIYAGFEHTIESRVSQRTYGVGMLVPFNENLPAHSQRESLVKVIDQKPYLKAFSAHCYKGQEIYDGFKTPLQRYFLVSETYTTIDLEIFTSTSLDVEFLDDPGISRITTISIPIMQNGQTYNAVDAQFEFLPTEIKFHVLWAGTATKVQILNFDYD